MKLSQYLDINEITLSAFADAVGVANPSVVQKWAKQTRVPKPALMRRIFLVTGGAVQPNDFFDLPDLKLAA